MLRLQAERFAVEDMVFDVAGPLGSGSASRVLMVGMLDRQVQRVQALCAAAGLKLAGVEPTAMALVRQVGAGSEPLVVMGEQGGEFVWQNNGVPLMLRHLAGAADASGGATAAVVDEIKRTLMMRPASTAAPRSLLVWDRHPVDERGWSALSAAGLDVRRVASLDSSPELAPSALNGEAGRERPEMFLPAIAVALSAAAPSGSPPVNFLSPRLAAPKARRFSRATVLSVLAAAVVVLGLAGLFYDVKSREAQMVALEARLDGMQPDVKRAEERLARFGYGRKYFDQRPPVLDCMADIAQAFGRDSSIWATGFSLSDNRKGTLHGKATNQPAALALRDRLEKDPNFASLQLLDLREGTGANRDVTFSMSFIYTGASHAQ